MKFAYIVNIDGYKLLHECTYHTREQLPDGAVRRIYPRFHNTGGTVTLNLVADEEESTGVFRCELQIHNETSHPVRISRADIGIAFDSTCTRLRYFTSDWGSEYSPREKEITAKFSYGSVSGRSSKGFTPYAQCLTDDGAYSLALGWSGNWTCTVFPWQASYCNVKPYTYCCIMGLTDEGFFHDIPAGGCFVTPAVYVTKGEDAEQAGLNLRRYFKKHISLLDEARFSPLPAAYNGWWPYEDRFISEEVFLQNAAIAKELGLQYAVLDAGWFGQTVDGQSWFEKRGDWDQVNPNQFPNGIRAMNDSAKALGILPGIWCEIEAVGEVAKLRGTHDHLLAKRDGRSLGYVCFGSGQAHHWAMEVIDRLLGEYGAKWIKIDFNLDPGLGCNRTDHDHGAGDGLYAHYTQYYRFLDEIRARYPDVIVENCASGGLRGDIEMLRHCHWSFLSDPDHTELHLQIYWGALSMLHQSALEHFSWSQVLQDHNMGVLEPVDADTPLYRFDYMIRAAMLGVPEFSYRLPQMPEHLLQRLKEHIAFFRQTLSDFVLRADAHRLTAQPLTGGLGERFPAFQFVKADGSALVAAFRLPGAPQQTVLYPRALHRGKRYSARFVDGGISREATAEEWMQQGIALEGLPEEGSEIVLLTPVC